ncbi:MAG: RpiB/LacA/LacB family sugar-phosphate isomerase [Vicinamibacterales bacterium]|jgi:ribose 5-phosphate isomerase B|nr:hypothetical protein [Acidobacteriota bacterium]MDP7295375.1 RpiB/LacA/LacB family sugar-phosphate isomerase [Vicinamibacterales bacterium]MDP7471653.1 RpiB/LacA/LacB family sugar-phosphate isomerase [Vicinamibacterales bacterium]MDP7672930.1 RpiB/LacA/LacB family sugar-phosphate isomerase [Vicinamibacterales bacterium]HJO39756.1 RpiB/LacA/LacB family sugar-phosphate isomerase [Vicinamibacterales bacterium]
MKRFQIITEDVARDLEPGTTVELAREGQITPLARDTLSARRVTVVRQGEVGADELSRAATREIRVVAVGADHTGVDLKREVLAHLRSRGLTARDLGTHSSDRVDYPDVAADVARAVARGDADAGVVIDGAGVGSAVAANKIAGIRAVMATEPLVARYAREHVGVNVLTLGATLVDAQRAAAVIDAWLSARMAEARYLRRVAKIRRLEQLGAAGKGRLDR